jgi:hypothetical protein
MSKRRNNKESELPLTHRIILSNNFLEFLHLLTFQKIDLKITKKVTEQVPFAYCAIEQDKYLKACLYNALLTLIVNDDEGNKHLKVIFQNWPNLIAFLKKDKEDHGANLLHYACAHGASKNVALLLQYQLYDRYKLDQYNNSAFIPTLMQYDKTHKETPGNQKVRSICKQLEESGAQDLVYKNQHGLSAAELIDITEDPVLQRLLPRDWKKYHNKGKESVQVDTDKLHKQLPDSSFKIDKPWYIDKREINLILSVVNNDMKSLSEIQVKDIKADIDTLFSMFTAVDLLRKLTEKNDSKYIIQIFMDFQEKCIKHISEDFKRKLNTALDIYMNADNEQKARIAYSLLSDSKQIFDAISTLLHHLNYKIASAITLLGSVQILKQEDMEVIKVPDHYKDLHVNAYIHNIRLKFISCIEPYIDNEGACRIPCDVEILDEQIKKIGECIEGLKAYEDNADGIALRDSILSIYNDIKAESQRIQGEFNNTEFQNTNQAPDDHREELNSPSGNSSEEIDEQEECIEICFGKLLHEFIMQFKTSEAKRPGTGDAIYWKIGEHIYSSAKNPGSGIDSVDKMDGNLLPGIIKDSATYYVYTDDAYIKSNYENVEDLLKSAPNAINHGLLKPGSKQKNGIKFLDDLGICTIKCASKDNRIYADTAYTVQHGKKSHVLLIFNKVVTHADFKNLPNKTIAQVTTEEYIPKPALAKTSEEWEELYQGAQGEKSPADINTAVECAGVEPPSS